MSICHPTCAAGLLRLLRSPSITAPLRPSVRPSSRAPVSPAALRLWLLNLSTTLQRTYPPHVPRFPIKTLGHPDPPHLSDLSLASISLSSLAPRAEKYDHDGVLVEPSPPSRSLQKTPSLGRALAPTSPQPYPVRACLSLDPEWPSFKYFFAMAFPPRQVACWPQQDPPPLLRP